MDKIPEKFLNEDGTLNTDSLVKSYNELEKKIGTMVSVPNAEADDKTRERFYRAIGVPDDVNEYPVNDMFDDDSIKQKFHDIGLTCNQVAEIYSIANEFLSPLISELFDVKNETSAYSELKNFFGNDEKMKDALRAINTFGERFLPHDAFESLCSTPQGIQSVYKMMQSVEPDVQTQKNESENLSDDDLRRMMRDPKYWRDGDAEYIRKIENGFKKLYS
ncbi:MAG: hypothetical protein J6S74_02805 [Alphaproteobacteria bacterium]|nr:hypothetical protein [Alphaproteobacteria bacterium]